MAQKILSKGIAEHAEAIAGEAGIYPGMLIKLNSSGQVVRHSIVGGLLGDETLIAEEDALQGKTVDDVYVSGQLVFYLVPHKGAEVNVLVEDGQDIAIGDKLMSSGNGLFREAGDLDSAAARGHVPGVATETVDLTTSAPQSELVSMRVV